MSIVTAGVKPYSAPPAFEPRSVAELAQGIGIEPAVRLANFSADELELVTRCWLWERKSSEPYVDLLQYGGTGDKGRDVVALVSDAPAGPWDNFQCKQYSKKLAPGDVLAELAKLVHNVNSGNYTSPRIYFFVAPRGFSNDAQDLIRNPEQIRKRLLNEWPSHGKKLCDFASVEAHLKTCEFPKLKTVDGPRMIRDLEGTPAYARFFGGGFVKARPAKQAPPADVDGSEMPYLQALIDAYSEHANTSLELATARSDPKYGEHLEISRESFYEAEALRVFSRGHFDAETSFEDLQTEMHDAIRHTVMSDYADGFQRVLKVCEVAVLAQIDSHPLSIVMRPTDRSGICHQLANDGKVKWRNS
jgi:hypothetical protein